LIVYSSFHSGESYAGGQNIVFKFHVFAFLAFWIVVV